MSESRIVPIKINRFGEAKILNPQKITLLFTEGLVNPPTQLEDLSKALLDLSTADLREYSNPK